VHSVRCRALSAVFPFGIVVAFRKRDEYWPRRSSGKAQEVKKKDETADFTDGADGRKNRLGTPLASRADFSISHLNCLICETGVIRGSICWRILDALASLSVQLYRRRKTATSFVERKCRERVASWFVNHLRETHFVVSRISSARRARFILQKLA
jgi:hypothetical protein